MKISLITQKLYFYCCQLPLITKILGVLFKMWEMIISIKFQQYQYEQRDCANVQVYSCRRSMQVGMSDLAVGKSSFVKQYSESIFIETHKPTIGVEFVKKMVVVDKRKVELQIWDTAGQEQFRSMIKSFYRGAAAVFVLYGVNQRDSFQKLHEWLQELQESAHEEIVKILVGNKSDLDREVSKQEAEKFMNDNNFSVFFETSAKTGENVEKAFVEAVKLVIMRMFTSESFKNSIKTIKKTSANSRQNTSRNEPIDDVAQISKPIQLQVTPQSQQKQEKQCC